ncbi:undecaprenyl-diphosphate phosphatase [Zwartia panacis]|uniref:undecaprenyl-diphosphate phosphatase n=1 Tax=Zwartia panacis TaxID=2683345 RepID=UPI0025B2CAF8|nr:undecaprenyl-diphosphate phosphatase [Zwartia panacis]MDN4017964.1 undecaprenyl-diphosphate phosphatase [Zwartia panacis]
MTEQTIYLWKAFFLGIVEGITEFLPISSTGHLILFGDWINFESNEAKVFEVVIQLGSILAVVWIFRQRLFQMIRGTLRLEPVEVAFTRNLLIAFLPSAIVGLLFIKAIKALFFHPGVVVVTLVLGGLIMLWVERRRPANSALDNANQVQTLEKITWKQALVVGCAQCLAMIPGTSRSGATIIAGMLSGIQRKTATEFSFFLAMPTMLAAAVYDFYKHAHLLTQQDTLAIAVGFVSAFVCALLVVRAILVFVSRHTYRAFAWYRIALGLVVGAWLWL